MVVHTTACIKGCVLISMTLERALSVRTQPHGDRNTQGSQISLIHMPRIFQ
jgi:hypothetical protein